MKTQVKISKPIRGKDIIVKSAQSGVRNGSSEKLKINVVWHWPRDGILSWSRMDGGQQIQKWTAELQKKESEGSVDFIKNVGPVSLHIPFNKF